MKKIFLRNLFLLLLGIVIMTFGGTKILVSPWSCENNNGTSCEYWCNPENCSGWRSVCIDGKEVDRRAAGRISDICGNCSKSCGGGIQQCYTHDVCGSNFNQVTRTCNTQPCPTSIPPSATPILPTVTMTPTPVAATPSPVPCTRKAQGDANCDGKISGIDYSIWLNSQCHPAAGQTCNNLSADFNKDGNVDDADYQAWFTNRGT